MELGLAGRRALVCAASKGLGRGCAEALARESVDVTICARTEEDVARAAAEIGELAGRPVAWVACDITTPDGRARALGACPRSGHPGEQRRRAAAGRFPRLGPRGVDSRARREHADADRTDQGDDRRDDRAQVRPHRQHHVERGQGADRHPRPVERRALGPHGIRCGSCAQSRAAQRHDQQPAARVSSPPIGCARRSRAARRRPASRTTKFATPR